jgi:outer membrane protein
MNKLATFTFVLSALALNASFAHADDTKIGVVDMQKAIQSSADGKKAKAELETAFNKKKKELDDQGAALKKEQEDFQKKQAALSDTAKREKGSKLQEKMMKYQELLQKSNVEIQKKEQEMSEPIIRKIREKVSEIAKKKNLSIVLEKNDNIVIYSEDKNDITSDVISAIN